MRIEPTERLNLLKTSRGTNRRPAAHARVMWMIPGVWDGGAMYTIRSAISDNSPVIEIDEQIYSKLKESKRCLVDQFQFEEKFDIILENYKDFETERFAISLDVELFSHQTTPQVYARRRNLIRRIMNVLTSIRLYLDVIASMEKGKPHYADLRKYVNALYDGNFSYRLMEGIRNHIQHRGSPFAAGQHSRRLDRESGAFFRIGTSVYLEVDAVINDRTTKASLKKELQDLDGKTLEINKLISSYIGCIARLHDYWRSVNLPSLQKSSDTYMEYFRRYHELSRSRPEHLFLKVTHSEESQNSDSEFEISTVVIENLSFLRDKNQGLDNLEMRFISSMSRTDGDKYFDK
ncbi:MAG: hypothetical protein HC888_04545 [Candidatus Competibacteraceae bacterium]|nr:hypothetical protein [Candidatus Competibacteraceae bacterium]